MSTDRDGVVQAKLTMLKYMHVLLCATQCASVNAQSCVCGAEGYFLPLISTAAGLGRCPPHSDKDAVCGPLLGACVAACIQTPEQLVDGQEVFERVFIGLSPQLKHGDIPEWLC